jgi:alpha-1,2-mannosyltransferase
MTRTGVWPSALHRSKRGGDWLDWAVWAWVILAVAAAAKQIVEGPSHNVYPIFAAAARHWWADVPLHARYEGLDLFLYSPTSAIAFTPFALLPDRLGGMLWSVGSIALWVWALRVVVRDVLPGEWTHRSEAVFLGLALVNSARGVWSAQSNSLIFALAVFALAAVKREHWWRAALLLACCTLVKLWPAMLAAMLVIFWPRKLLGRFAAATAALAALPFLTRPPWTVIEQYRGWYLCLTGPVQTRLPGFRDAWTIWEQVDPPVFKPGYVGIQVATALVLLGWCFWQSRRAAAAADLRVDLPEGGRCERGRSEGGVVPVRNVLTWVLASWVAWQLLFGPGSERLTYQLYAPLAAWAVVASVAAGRGRALSLFAWLATGLLGTGGVERMLLPWLHAAPMILPLGGVLFIAWMVLYFPAPATLRVGWGIPNGRGPSLDPTRRRRGGLQPCNPTSSA